jgi:hypothetical protein
MLARALADAVVVVHAAFVVFVVAGGLLVLRHRRIAWLHVPAVAWAAYIEVSGGVCPLTPLENALRGAAGDAGYAGGFIEHYLIPLIYPAGLTPAVQLALGVFVVTLNLAVYATAWRRWRRDAAEPDAERR